MSKIVYCPTEPGLYVKLLPSNDVGQPESKSSMIKVKLLDLWRNRPVSPLCIVHDDELVGNRWFAIPDTINSPSAQWGWGEIDLGSTCEYLKEIRKQVKRAINFDIELFILRFVDSQFHDWDMNRFPTVLSFNSQDLVWFQRLCKYYGDKLHRINRLAKSTIMNFLFNYVQLPKELCQIIINYRIDDWRQRLHSFYCPGDDDDYGLDKNELKTICTQTACDLTLARRSLRKTQNIVDAILLLTP